MNRMRSRSYRTAGPRALIAAGLVLLLSSPGRTGPAPDPPHQPPQANTQVAKPKATVAPAGTRRLGANMVVSDHGSATLGAPSASQMLELGAQVQNGLLRTTAGLTAVRLADGSMMLDLRGRYREFAVARVDPAAGVRLGCVHHQRALRRALDPCAPPPPGYEER